MIGLNLFMWAVGFFALGCVIYCIFKDAKSVGKRDRHEPRPVSDYLPHNKEVAHDPTNSHGGTSGVFRK